MNTVKLIIIIIFISLTSYAQVGIGTTTPDGSSALDVTSTTQGFLPPRITDPDVDIASPATGLLIYNTTANCIQVNTGTPALPVWECISNDTGSGSGSGSGSGLSTLDFPWETDLRFKSVSHSVVYDDNNDFGTVLAATSVGVSTNNNPYVWGYDNQSSSPAKISNPAFEGKTVKYTYYNSFHMLLNTDGEIYYWFGRLAPTGASSPANVLPYTTTTTTQKVMFASGVTKAVDMLEYNSYRNIVYIGDDGNVYQNTGGIRDVRIYPKPSGVLTSFKYTKFIGTLAAGNLTNVIMFLRGNDSKVYAIAENSNSSFSHGSGNPSTSPAGVYEVNFPAGAGVIKKIDGVRRGPYYTVYAISENGKMYGWGLKEKHTTSSSSSPVDENYIKSNNSATTSSWSGISGHRWNTYYSSPVEVALPPGETKVIDIEDGFFITDTNGFYADKTRTNVATMTDIYTDLRTEYVKFNTYPETLVGFGNSLSNFGDGPALYLIEVNGRLSALGPSDFNSLGGFPNGLNDNALRTLPLPILNGNLDSTNPNP